MKTETTRTQSIYILGMLFAMLALVEIKVLVFNWIQAFF